MSGPSTGDARAEPTAVPGAPTTRFALRWLGYDRAQVDACIQQLVAERQRLRARLVAAEALESSRRHEQAGDIVSLARRHADEIRAAAEHEAHRLLHEAEQRVSLRESEQTEALSRDRDRIASLHRDIEWCLATVGTALDRVRGLAATDGNPKAGASPTAPVVPLPAGQMVGAVSLSRLWPVRGVMAVWALVMVAIVLMLMMRPVWPAGESSPGTQDGSSPAALPEPSGSAPAEPSELSITFVATGDCWITVSADEGRPSERLLKPSESLVVQAHEIVELKAGNAAALSIRINDQPVAPLGREGQVVTLRITRDNYRTLLQEAVSRSMLSHSDRLRG